MSRTLPLVSAALVSAVTTTSLFLLMGAKAPVADKTDFREINVERINVREPDGRLRMVIANRAKFPGSPWRGKEIPRPDRTEFAGMLFMNDEGTENGGLIQKGVIAADGKPSAGLSLTFDRFRQDQVVQLLHAEESGRAYSFLSINDEADGSQFDLQQRSKRMAEISKLSPEKADVAMQQMAEQGQLSRNRVRLGTTMDGAAVLSLADGLGRPRMMLLVAKDGTPMIQMIGDRGEVEKTIQLDAATAPTKG
jgi:phage gp46-like protein